MGLRGRRDTDLTWSSPPETPPAREEDHPDPGPGREVQEGPRADQALSEAGQAKGATRAEKLRAPAAARVLAETGGEMTGGELLEALSAEGSGTSPKARTPTATW